MKGKRGWDEIEEQWAQDVNISDGSQIVTTAVASYLRYNTMPTCPAGGIYTYAVINVDPSCSLAEPSNPHKRAWHYLP